MNVLHELLILIGMVAAMFIGQLLIKWYFNRPDATEVYIFADSRGHKVKIVVRRRCSAEEREKIFNEKARELIALQNAGRESA